MTQVFLFIVLSLDFFNLGFLNKTHDEFTCMLGQKTSNSVLSLSMPIKAKQIIYCLFNMSKTYFEVHFLWNLIIFCKYSWVEEMENLDAITSPDVVNGCNSCIVINSHSGDMVLFPHMQNYR